MKLSVMTCNVRCSGAHKTDGKNAWPFRRDVCAQLIRAHDPDVIGFQEMWDDQFSDMTAALPCYDHFGMVDMPVGRRPMNSIFFRRAVFRRLSAGGYWLSQTPHVPGSKSWDSACVRLANWVRLEPVAGGPEFRFINTHLDHISEPARKHQADCIVADAAAYPNDYPQVLVGDMNDDFKSRAIAAFTGNGWRDSHAAVHGPADPGFTFHAFQGSAYESKHGKIDWIFSRGKVVAKDSKVIYDFPQGQMPSDHYFVWALLDVAANDANVVDA